MIAKFGLGKAELIFKPRVQAVNSGEVLLKVKKSGVRVNGRKKEKNAGKWEKEREECR